jgi:DNA modification methylase
MFDDRPYEVICGDAREVVDTLPPVDCVVTSPPYFKQRQYGEDGREFGQEKEADEFISGLVQIFNRITLAPWGSVWVNIGNKRGSKGELLAITSKFVVAMLKAGYYLIDDVVWAKEIVKVDGECIGHTMVEPAPGRLNGNGWEPFYRFVTHPDYAWSDTCSIRIPRENCPENHRYRPADIMQVETMEEGRNCTNVWSINTSRKGNAHFAAFPAALVERPIAMTCPEWVTESGPRERIVESTEYDEGRNSKRVFGQYSLADEELLRKDETTLTEEEKVRLDGLRKKSGRMDTARVYTPKYPKTLGWTHADLPARPGIVLDPFAGTGTVGEVAIKLGRRFIGIELYPDVAARADNRCNDAVSSIDHVESAHGHETALETRGG